MLKTASLPIVNTAFAYRSMIMESTISAVFYHAVNHAAKYYHLACLSFITKHNQALVKRKHYVEENRLNPYKELFHGSLKVLHALQDVQIISSENTKSNL
uniref:Uncharacterized protein n=1 Tax=Pyxicephalus adspersus TaxID=30357 RepID=A0AAV2ZIZ4_PYXAD|nr:TPA: hypothetical protein GDO54_003394 [Pyxicephalus adspersus]